MILAALMLSGCISIKMTYRTYKDPEKYSVGDFEYDAGKVKSVSVGWLAGKVNVNVSSDARLSVKESGSAESDEEKLHWIMDGDTLRIEFCASGYIKKDVSWKKELTLSIPEGIELVYEGVSCDFTAPSLPLSAAKIATVSGDVSIGSVSSLSGLSVASVSGNVDISSASAPDISVESVSGNVVIALAEKCTFKAESVSGNVTADTSALSGATVKISTVSGRITSALDKKEGEKGAYVSGDGSSEIKIDTVSGRINIK